MKKLILPLLVLGIFACTETPENQSVDTKQPNQPGLRLLTENNPEWACENLRIYPIVADETTISAGANLVGLKTTGEAMNAKGFRITELKDFGRGRDASINGLTVANKTDAPVFLMSGDVVTGGNQDRVIAHDQVIAAKSIQNTEVFCVEHGRWQYFDENAPESEKKVAAFRGYYNVASSEVRQAIHRRGSQQEVWDAVAKVTKANGAASESGTYAALETESEQKTRREAILKFFDGKFSARPDVVGMVVVSGDKVLGTDVFGHPDLFRRQFKSLLHGYATDAASLETTSATTVSGETVSRQTDRILAAFSDPNVKSTAEIGKFGWNGATVHVYSK